MTTAIDGRLKEAIRLLGVYSAGRFDVWALTGRPKASCRAHVMSALLGVKTPQSKSGINALREEFWRRSGIEGDCIASRESNFVAFCKGI